jgi:hypothetical protein
MAGHIARQCRFGHQPRNVLTQRDAVGNDHAGVTAH